LQMDFFKKSFANLSAAATSVATDDPFVGKSVQINDKTYLVRKKLAEGLNLCSLFYVQ
jgi:hypothetical protein